MLPGPACATCTRTSPFLPNAQVILPFLIDGSTHDCRNFAPSIMVHARLEKFWSSIMVHVTVSFRQPWHFVCLGHLQRQSLNRQYMFGPRCPNHQCGYVLIRRAARTYFFVTNQRKTGEGALRASRPLPRPYLTALTHPNPPTLLPRFSSHTPCRLTRRIHAGL